MDTQNQRDRRDLSRLRAFEMLPKLLRIAATHTGQLINVADMAASFELTRRSDRLLPLSRSRGVVSLGIL